MEEQTDGKTDKQTLRQTDKGRQMDRQMDGWKDADRHSQTDGRTERQTDRWILTSFYHHNVTIFKQDNQACHIQLLSILLYFEFQLWVTEIFNSENSNDNIYMYMICLLTLHELVITAFVIVALANNAF